MPPTEPTRGEGREEPVSLAPLTPEEALRALLAVKPDDESGDRADAETGERPGQ